MLFRIVSNWCLYFIYFVYSLPFFSRERLQYIEQFNQPALRHLVNSAAGLGLQNWKTMQTKSHLVWCRSWTQCNKAVPFQKLKPLVMPSPSLWVVVFYFSLPGLGSSFFVQSSVPRSSPPTPASPLEMWQRNLVKCGTTSAMVRNSPITTRLLNWRRNTKRWGYVWTTRVFIF